MFGQQPGQVGESEVIQPYVLPAAGPRGQLRALASQSRTANARAILERAKARGRLTPAELREMSTLADYPEGNFSDYPAGTFDNYPELGLKATIKGVHIDTKSPAAHVKSRVAAGNALKAKALAGDRAAWEQLWQASSRNLPIRRPVASVPPDMGKGFHGWPRVTTQLTAMLAEIEKAYAGNQTQTGPGAAAPPGVAAPGTIVDLPGAGPVMVPPILQPGVSITGPNASPTDYSSSSGGGGGGGGGGYDPGGGGAPPAAPMKLADMMGGKAGLLVAAAGAAFTLSQILSDHRRR